MMVLLPFTVILIGSYFLSKRLSTLLQLFVIALPIYTISLAFIYKFTGDSTLTMGVKVWKDLLPLIFFTIILLTRRKRLGILPLTLLDVLVQTLLIVNIIHLMLPNEAGFVARLLSFRINTFFGIIYFLGRVIPIPLYRQEAILKLLVWVGALSGVLTIFELLQVINIPESSDLMLYTESVFNQQTAGDFGLSWTFQTAFGYRRYSSFFANPLELASSTLLTGSAALFLLYGILTTWKQRFLYRLAFLFIVVGLLLSISRMSTIAFVIHIAVLTFWLRRYKLFLSWVVFLIAGTVIVMNHPLIGPFIMNTIEFTNPSSIGHASDWQEGINAIISQPTGLGLGISGPTASRFGDHIGGENQFIITGVELGLPGLLLYIAILALAIIYGYRGFKHFTGATSGLCFVAAASRLGFLLPSMTSAIETYIFIMFVSWWLVGFTVQQLQTHDLAVLRFRPQVR